MRLVLFDCDGTLVDSQHMIIMATESALRQHGFDAPPRKDILRAVGLPLDVAMRHHAPNLDDATLVEVLNAYREVSQSLVQQDDRGQIMFDGMYKIICHLGNDDETLLGIVTMKSRHGLDRVVDAYNIRRFFQTLKSADDGPGKPAPDLVSQAMAECGVRADQVVMVGDTSFDMIMAKAADVYAIGVAWGYQEIEEMEEAGADAIAETPTQLQHLLDQFQPDA